MKNVKIVLVLLTIILSVSSYAQDHILKIYRIQNKNCGDYIYESQEIASGVAYETEAKIFKTTHSKENPNTIYVKSNDYAIVLEYTTHLYPGACEYKEIQVQKGSSLVAIRKNYKDLYSRYKGVYITEPKELQVFEPKTKQTTTIIAKTFLNLNARFIPQTENGKQAITAQFTNTNTAKSIAVKMITRDSNNKILKEEPIVLKSGETITKKFGEANSYEINISEPFESFAPKEKVDFIESIKNWTKETIPSKEFNRKATGIGLRG